MQEFKVWILPGFRKSLMLGIHVAEMEFLQGHERPLWSYEGKAWVVAQIPRHWGYKAVRCLPRTSCRVEPSREWSVKPAVLLVRVITRGIELQARLSSSWFWPLVLYFLTVPASPPFGLGIYVLCHCMLEVRNWLSDLQGRQGTALSLRREFGTALRLNDYGNFWYWTNYILYDPTMGLMASWEECCRLNEKVCP